jgi:hypothetical protein
MKKSNENFTRVDKANPKYSGKKSQMLGLDEHVIPRDPELCYEEDIETKNSS